MIINYLAARSLFYTYYYYYCIYICIAFNHCVILIPVIA